jgi:hypothetical protein
MGPLTDRVSFGRVGAELVDRALFIRFRTTTPSNPVPLAFAVVQPVATDDTSGLMEARYYPAPDPTVVQLGPGVADTFTGIIRLRPRRWNTRWLQAGYPSRSWRVEADAWIPAGVVVPFFNPDGFTDGARILRPSTQTVGPAGAAPLTDA